MKKILIKNKCDVTIAIINYNRFKYIDRAVRSCLDQNLTFKTHEVLIVDDNSSDKSMEYISAHPHLKKYLKVYKNKKNYGAGYCSKISCYKKQWKIFYES